MPTKNVTDDRFSKFKNKGKDSAKRREKRIEVCVQLRKAQKDEEVCKRRNMSMSSVVDEEALSPEYISDEKVASLSIEDIIKEVKSSCRESQTRGCQAARKLLSQERNPPMKEIIDAGLLSCFVAFLGMDDEPSLQFEAAWALTNIASGTPWHTQQVVDHGAVQPFISLLTSPHLHIREQAVWALGNIAGDGPHYRDALIDCGVIPAILALTCSSLQVGYLRNITWTISNLCRNKNPFPPLSAVQQLLPCVTQLLHHSDQDILCDSCWAISYLTDGDNDRIDIVVKTGIVPRLVELMGHDELSVMAAWALSNIVAGPCKQIQQVITCGLLPLLVELLRTVSIAQTEHWVCVFIQINQCVLWVLLDGDFKTQREAVWAVTNFTSGGTVEQVVQLVQSGALEAIIDLLQVKDAKVILVILEAINNMLLAAEKIRETEKLTLLIEEMGGLDRIEMLQNHSNEMVYQAAHNLIEKYFADDETEGPAVDATKDEFVFQTPVQKQFEF
uniref:Importin subunit alpha n=1 Tax=Sphaeramia orbicularis TaxID=375764 RepID=A0A673AJK5_9TELE